MTKKKKRPVVMITTPRGKVELWRSLKKACDHYIWGYDAMKALILPDYNKHGFYVERIAIK